MAAATPIRRSRAAPVGIDVITLVPIVVLGFVAGCGRPAVEVPALGTVTGVVTLDGAPLDKAALSFVPTEREGRGSYAVTDAAGRYELRYDASLGGAVLGGHRVEIRTGGEGRDKDGNFYESKEKLPAKYHSQSTLTATVSDGPNQIDFDLRSR